MSSLLAYEVQGRAAELPALELVNSCAIQHSRFADYGASTRWRTDTLCQRNAMALWISHGTLSFYGIDLRSPVFMINRT
jgi:hypothetical protein